MNLSQVIFLHLNSFEVIEPTRNKSIGINLKHQRDDRIRKQDSISNY